MVEAKEAFSIATEIPLIGYLNHPKRKSCIITHLDNSSFATAELAMAELLSALLRLAAAKSADRCFFLTFTHNARNVMSGHSISLCHSVIHYEAKLFKEEYIISQKFFLRLLNHLKKLHLSVSKSLASSDI